MKITLPALQKFFRVDSPSIRLIFVEDRGVFSIAAASVMLVDGKNEQKIVEKDAETKIARKRLSVLEMAETLGNISEACRRGGMDRTSFYEWKRRFQTHGLEGLKDMPTISKDLPNRFRWKYNSKHWKSA